MRQYGLNSPLFNATFARETLEFGKEALVFPPVFSWRISFLVALCWIITGRTDLGVRDDIVTHFGCLFPPSRLPTNFRLEVEKIYQEKKYGRQNGTIRQNQ
ncbi:hypothetical protein I7I53_04815 [Histoplasma capsulatum var. duboisii H88]|uniref:Uncharacterized protein n=1 Tax=Ajellomyces capsulatus (strain H88) TaxID=544711 RepID=A0A8A1LVI4_AJEC8|nr:hypothetical protein I7I53_04815 [Histoplasma capsulatum var. duboisii H88]